MQNVLVMLINDNWPAIRCGGILKLPAGWCTWHQWMKISLNYKQLIAPLPPHPIDKCKMDISILVMLTIEKFLYHMPVWRQQQRLRHYGIDLPYSTLCSLVNRTCEVLEPLWHLLLKEITSSGLINMDETRYRVLDNTKKKGKKSHIGWMWASMNPMQRIVCFMYQQGRGKKDIRPVLHGYKGYLMTDAYGAYTKYGKQPGVTHQHCLRITEVLRLCAGK